jgi:proline racemase
VNGERHTVNGKRYKTIDAHVAGEAVRLLVEGAPTVKGRTMADKLTWLRRHGEPLRKALMLEPRGHAGMHGALFTEPASAAAHAGLLFMNAGGFPLVSGEAVMAAVAIGIARKIIQGESTELHIDTPVGLLTARIHSVKDVSETEIGSVAIMGLSGFVQTAAVPIQLGGRVVPVDIAFGGESYAIADGEAVGIPVDADHAPELIRAGRQLLRVVDASIDGVIFSAPARHDGHLRTATVLGGDVLRRSPGVTGTIALMAVLDAMGILEENTAFTNEGIVGTMLTGRVLEHRTVEDKPVICPVIESPVSITGYHEFVVDERGPSFRI